MNQPDPAAATDRRTRVRFTLDWIEITDSMDLDSVGEFRFLFRLRSERRGLLRDTYLPPDGTLEISEDPEKNHLGPLDLVLWEGAVEPGETVVLEATGEEVDLLSPNDELEWYERVFQGDPAGWVRAYGPWDGEGTPGPRPDPESLAQWRLAYRVETMAGPDEDAATPDAEANSR